MPDNEESQDKTEEVIDRNAKLEVVGKAESSRKFMSFVRKSLVLYLRSLLKINDLETLGTVHRHIRQNQSYHVCLKDLGDFALGNAKCLRI